MTRRIRALSGMLGLLALMLSFAEAGVASVCAIPAASATFPDTHTSGVHDAGEQELPASGCAVLSADDCCGGEPCAWMVMMGAGCTAPASLGSSSPALDQPSPERARRAVWQADLPPAYPTDPLLRPPRA